MCVQLSSWVHSLPAYYKMTKSWQISRQKPVPDHFSIKQWTKDLLLADIYFSIERHFWSLQLFWQKWLAFCMYNLWPHYIHHTTLHYTTQHYWAVQWSWFARVNALCNLSRKKSREVAASLPGRFLSRRCFTLCITMEDEPKIAKQYKCQHCCSCKNYRERGWRVEKKGLCVIFWLTRRSRVCGKKMRFGASYSTSNKLLLVARHILTTDLQNCL